MKNKPGDRIKPYQWQKGQSGNPGGRPKGSGKVQKKIRQEAAELAMLNLATDARKLLQDNSVQITAEILTIALQPPVETVTKGKAGNEVVKVTYPQARIKCLLACFERIVPVLKTVEVKDGSIRRPSELSDDEIVALMERMVAMAQSGGAGHLRPPGGGDNFH